MSTSKALEELEKLVQLFSSQELPEMCKQVFIKNVGPSRRWSLGNKLVMLIHGTADARGYRQWQEAGRYVKKGSKALYILAPMIRHKKVKNEETGQEEDMEFPVGFVGIPVFRYEDTEGKPIEEYQPRQIPPLLDVAEKFGVRVEYGPTVHGEGGSYNLVTNVIKLCQETQTRSSMSLHTRPTRHLRSSSLCRTQSRRQWPSSLHVFLPNSTDMTQQLSPGTTSRHMQKKRLQKL